ncbi:cell division protein FtsX [Novosphingobium terrae]|uniref:cell division protein FtsX n=1 Tax=Novosphingobium terrae TaxID=2726189 RepID=UPI001F1315D0|nr:cell division protein [Novosphingobium terrae]
MAEDLNINEDPAEAAAAEKRLLRLPGFGNIRGRGADSELVPQARLSGPMPWVIAIMVALTVIAAATGLALRNIALAAAADLSGGVSVQVLDAGEGRDRQISATLKALQDAPGVASVQLVSAQEVNNLLAPWLGGAQEQGVSAADVVPVPALIDVKTNGPADEAQLEKLRKLLGKVAPAARVDAQSHWLSPVFGAIDSLQWLAAAMVGLLGVAMTAAVLLATRSALGQHRETIAIVHMMGGTDSQIARIFQRAIGLDAFAGAALGLAVAVAAVLVLGRRFAGLGAGLIAGGALGWLDWALMVLIPLAAVVLAVVTARVTVLSALRRML